MRLDRFRGRTLLRNEKFVTNLLLCIAFPYFGFESLRSLILSHVGWIKCGPSLCRRIASPYCVGRPVKPWEHSKWRFPRGGRFRNMRPERKSQVQLSRSLAPRTPWSIENEIGDLCRDVSAKYVRDKCASRISF
jgi:hypothetical protein